MLQPPKHNVRTECIYLYMGYTYILHSVHRPGVICGLAARSLSPVADKAESYTVRLQSTSGSDRVSQLAGSLLW